MRGPVSFKGLASGQTSEVTRQQGFVRISRGRIEGVGARMEPQDDLQDRVHALTAPELELLGFDLVDFEALGGGNRLTLRFSVERRLADGEAGDVSAKEHARITIDEVARASRAIARAIEAEEAEAGEFLGRYTIEVGSPGIFRKLTRPEHFRRYVGEIVKVVAKVGDESRQVRGELLACEDDVIRIAERGGDEVAIELSTVRRAKLDPDLDFGGKREKR